MLVKIHGQEGYIPVPPVCPFRPSKPRPPVAPGRPAIPVAPVLPDGPNGPTCDTGQSETLHNYSAPVRLTNRYVNRFKGLEGIFFLLLLHLMYL